MTFLSAGQGTVAALGASNFERQMAGDGLSIQFGPFLGRLRLQVPDLCAPLFELYSHYPVVTTPEVHSFHATLKSVRSHANPFRRKVRFLVDGQAPHEDMPLAQALPVLEWGINLVIALRFHCNLMLHAAVIERNGFCMLMPAMPGDGKTTLCAGLIQHGWRLFSDEFGLIRPGTDQFIPLPRPLALKNASIDVIRRFAPDAHIGPSTPNTRKGTVAHLRPMQDSVDRMHETAPPGLIVFPRWIKDAELLLTPMNKADAFMNLGSNAFNFELQGEEGFDTVDDIIRRSHCYALDYSNLHEAVASLSELSDTHHG